MARRGQVGTIVQKGNYYRLRFWKYPVGEKRRYVSEIICPIDPNSAGYLSKGERQRRALEIVEASGVNDKQQFIETNVGTTFRQQAAWFLKHADKRKRKPVKAQTLKGWHCCVDNWLNPTLGDLPLASINNRALKELVEKFSDAELAPQTIVTYANLAKLIVASAINEDGEQLFPRKWNNEFMDVPIVRDQYQPCFSVETVKGIIEKASGMYQVLYALLAGTGMRVGEAFALEIKHLSNDCRTITIEQSLFERKVQTPKTEAGYRQIDVPISLAKLLKSYVGDRTSGLLFPNESGFPLSQTNVNRRLLIPILKELGVKERGFHAFRRYRITWLRRQRTPEDLISFWCGHAHKTITDIYSKLSDDLEYRLEVAEKVGVGFNVPAPMAPLTPRKAVERAVEVVA